MISVYMVKLVKTHVTANWNQFKVKWYILGGLMRTVQYSPLWMFPDEINLVVSRPLGIAYKFALNLRKLVIFSCLALYNFILIDLVSMLRLMSSVPDGIIDIWNGIRCSYCIEPAYDMVLYTWTSLLEHFLFLSSTRKG